LKTLQEIQEIGLETIEKEALAVSGLRNSINENFAHCVHLICNSSGRVIITGIGKSANIATKIVSTFNSTGTPSIFMHAADAIHGDLGIIREDDIIICLSKSGETPEIKVLVPLLKSRGNKLIAIVGNLGSYLASQSDFIIDSSVEKEACPINMAPTASTTAQLVMGDALAMAVLECKGFTAEDFAKYHPGGALGKKMYLKVSDLSARNESPSVDVNADIKTVILEISSKRLGATIVMDAQKLVGIITDGDLRRMLEKYKSIDGINAGDIMSPDPKTIQYDSLVVNALDVMRKNNITQLAVEENGKYMGVVHLHDILKEGIL